MRKKFVQTLAAQQQLERLGPGGFISYSGAMDPAGQSQQQQQLQEHPPPPPDGGEDEIIEILDDDQEIELMMERHRKYHPRKYVNLQQPPSKIYYDKIDKLTDKSTGSGDVEKEDLLEDEDEQNQLVIDFMAREEATDLTSNRRPASRAMERDRTDLMQYRRCATPAPPTTAPHYRRAQDPYANHLLVEPRHRDKDSSTRVSTVERWSESLVVLGGTGGSVPLYQPAGSRVDGRIRMHPYDRLVAYDRAVPPSAVRHYESGKDEQRFVAPEPAGPPPPAEASLRSVPSSTINRNNAGQRRSAFSPPLYRGPNGGGGGAVALRSPLYYQQPSANVPLTLHHLFLLEEWYRSRGLPPSGLHASHQVPVPREMQSMAYYHQYHQHQPVSRSPMMGTAMGSHGTLQQHPSPPSYPPPQYGFAKPPDHHHHHAPLYGAAASTGQQSHLGYPQFRPASLPDAGPPAIVTQATVPPSTTRSPSCNTTVPSSSAQPVRFARPTVITNGATVPVIMHTPPVPPLPPSCASRPVPIRPPAPPPLVSCNAPVQQRPVIAQGQGSPAELTISTTISTIISSTISATIPTTVRTTVPTTIPNIPAPLPVPVAAPRKAKKPKAASPQFKTPVSIPPRPRPAKSRKNAAKSMESIAQPAAQPAPSSQPAPPSHSISNSTTTATTITNSTATDSSSATTTIVTAESGTSASESTRKALVEHMRNEMRTFLQGRRSDIVTTMRHYLHPRFEYGAMLKAMQDHSITYQDFLSVAMTVLRKCGRVGFAREPPPKLDYRWPAGPVQDFSQYFAQNAQCRSKAYVADYFKLLVLIVDQLVQQFADPLEYFLSTYALGLRSPNHATCDGLRQK